MRKVILLLLSLLAVNTAVYSQKEDIKPIKVIEETRSNTKGNLAPARIQVECFYYPFTNSLELLFLSDLGTVTVSLDNQTTGEICDHVGNSASGRVVVPVESDCAYRMDITTESGRSYYALFFTGSEECE